MKKAIFVFTMLCILSCTTSPGGRKQLLIMPKGQMDQMGQQSFAQLKSQSRMLRSGAEYNWVTCTTNEILRAIGEKPSQWEIQLFVDDSPNAFALPGNKMGVHTGMTRLAGDTSELAAVIGHEIAHVKASHGNERVSQNMVVQGGVAVAGVAFGQSQQMNQLIMAGLGIGVLMPFSRAHEKEADLLGLEYLVRAGYDPNGSVRLWRKMAKLGGRHARVLEHTPSFELPRWVFGRPHPKNELSSQ
ncbi:MAG: M48 family metallopeptidase [Pseudomonadota bacterium]